VIVVDASAVIDVLLGKPGAAKILSVMRGAASLHAPHLLDIEVCQVIRRYTTANLITDARGLTPWRPSQTWSSSATRTPFCSGASGRCGIILPPMTPPISPWRRRWAPNS